ncbi:hypothetical protein ACOSQ4_014487 [Xanthoceras sorbifolium]
MNGDKKKVHLVMWENVYCPKRSEGLGIKSMKDLNQALLVKAGWQIAQKEYSLWCNVIRSKYIKDDTFLDNKKCKGLTSCAWKGIKHGLTIINEGLVWRVGNGLDIRLWVDSWVPKVRTLACLDCS